MVVGSQKIMIINQPIEGYSPLIDELSPGILKHNPLLQTLPWRLSL